MVLARCGSAVALDCATAVSEARRNLLAVVTLGPQTSALYDLLIEPFTVTELRIVVRVQLREAGIFADDDNDLGRVIALDALDMAGEEGLTKHLLRLEEFGLVRRGAGLRETDDALWWRT